MEKTITLPNGKTYKVGFDFSTLLEVEELTNKQFTELDMSNRKDMLYLMYAAVKTFNEGVEPFWDWLHNIDSMATATTFSNIIGEHITHFFVIPPMAEEPVQAEESKDNKRP